MSDTRSLPTDDMVTRALRARSADPDLALLEDIVRTAAATPQLRRMPGLGPLSLPRRAVLVIALALLLATAGAIAVGFGLLPVPVPAEQLTVAGQIIEAANTRDPESLRSLMAEDGVLEFPWVDARAGREGEVYMSDYAMEVKQFPSVWLDTLDRWGMEAQLESCQVMNASTITCAVATRWHALRLEIGEAWTFEFDGARVRWLEMLRVDPDPPSRLLPLGLVDLPTWEAWLRVTHPSQAARLLPSGPDEYGWMYFRFAVGASPDEIGASIDEYLAARSVVESPIPSPSAIPTGSEPPTEWVSRMPGTRGSPAGVYGTTVVPNGRSMSAGMHNVVELGDTDYRQTQLTFAAADDCFSGAESPEPVPVTVAGLDGLYVEPYPDPSVQFVTQPDVVTTTGAYALPFGDTNLCVYLSWDIDTTPEELDAARQVVETIRGQPFGEDGIRINFTLPQGWDTG